METRVSQVQRSSNRKSVTELAKEIAMLEMEVLQLEKYIVSLYQKALDRRLASLPKDDDVLLSESAEQKRGSDRFQTAAVHDRAICSDEYRNNINEQEDMLGCSIHRSHSSLSHHSVFPSQFSPLVGKVVEAVNSYHSLPLTLLEPEAYEASNDAAIYNSSEVKETANWVSEEMVRCISAIYCELGAISNNFSSPTFSFPSSLSGSPHTELNLWSPQSKINSSLDLHYSVGNYQIRGHFEYNGPYCKMIEILQISKESTKLRDIDPLLQKFRSLVSRLERVNPTKLSCKEKLAFWINVHNALVMHAFLVHGVPENKLKRVSLVLKAAYSVGSQTVSVSMIQDYILGSKLPHPGQWFHKLLQIKKKFKTGDRSRLFAIDHTEPLSYFGLCCGSHSDPPVNVYTPQRVVQDLTAARNQYILSNYRVQKEQNKILLPKILENYAKDSGIQPPEFMKIIAQILPSDLQRNRRPFYNLRHRKGWKGIEWIAHDFSFRYQIPKELLQ